MESIPEHTRKSWITDDLANGVKGRIRLLILAGTLAVAIVFGLSFHFALLSNESAIARQMPELAEVAGKLRTMLMVNTLGFVGVIIASFYLLTSILTTRMFHPIGTVYRSLVDLGHGKMPVGTGEPADGPFSGLQKACGDAVGDLRTGLEKDIERLGECLSHMERPGGDEDSRRILGDMMLEKRKSLGEHVDTQIEDPDPGAGDNDPLFMQPA